MQKKKDKNKKWPIRERIKNQQPIETVQWPMYYPHMQYGGITTAYRFFCLKFTVFPLKMSKARTVPYLKLRPFNVF